MTQLLDHGDGQVTLYYTRPDKQGTVAFEHAVRVDIRSARYGRTIDGPEDPEHLLLRCPCGCGVELAVPLAGDGEAQEFHARHRLSTGKSGSLAAARASVAADVRARGREPRTTSETPALWRIE